jgi:hypothetical protein
MNNFDFRDTTNWDNRGFIGTDLNLSRHEGTAIKTAKSGDIKPKKPSFAGDVHGA